MQSMSHVGVSIELGAQSFLHRPSLNAAARRFIPTMHPAVPAFSAIGIGKRPLWPKKPAIIG